MNLSTNKYNDLVQNIGSALQKARANAIEAMHQQLLIANWEIGKYIVEFEQQGKEKAVYGSQLLSKLSKDLKAKHGKGFGISNLQYMRSFYIKLFFNPDKLSIKIGLFISSIKVFQYFLLNDKTS